MSAARQSCPVAAMSLQLRTSRRNGIGERCVNQGKPQSSGQHQSAHLVVDAEAWLLVQYRAVKGTTRDKRRPRKTNVEVTAKTRKNEKGGKESSRIRTAHLPQPTMTGQYIRCERAKGFVVSAAEGPETASSGARNNGKTWLLYLVAKQSGSLV